MRAFLLLLFAGAWAHAAVFNATGNIETLLESVDYIQKNTNGYVVPSSNDLDVWRSVISNISAGNLATAADLVSSIASTYKVIKFTDTSDGPRTYDVLMEADISGSTVTPIVTKGWGVVVFDPKPLRELVLQVPHPLADAN